MELFRLLGRIAIDNTEANSAINETTTNAQDSEKKQKKSFKGIGSAAQVLDKGIVGIGKSIGGAFVDAVEGTREYRTQMQIVLYSGVMVGELAPAIDQELGIISARKKRK